VRFVLAALIDHFKNIQEAHPLKQGLKRLLSVNYKYYFRETLFQENIPDRIFLTVTVKKFL
jgi:hypothetical protein